MEKEIIGVIPVKSQYMFLNIFAYSSHGVPGLEIKGLSKAGNILKEKIIYLSKSKKIKMPLNRYVICVERVEAERSISHDQVKWLELPILLLYWGLAGIIPLSFNMQCFCGGYFFTSGKIISMPLGKSLARTLNQREKAIWIGNQVDSSYTGKLISLDQMMEKTGLVSFSPQMERVLASSL